jgi:hypothetical protein
MTILSKALEGGQGTAPSSAPAARPLRWDDPLVMRQWLIQLRAQALDVVAIGEDATKAPRKRFFSRHEARRQLRKAERSLLALLYAAEQALPVDGQESTEPVGSELGGDP